MTITLGTHNLHDRAGQPTPFADLVFFTECAFDRLGLVHRMRGYDALVCKRQPSLAITFRRSLFDPIAGEYRLAHDGLAGVTPDRGTFGALGSLQVARREYVPTALLVEHRINAAFPEQTDRGERDWRRARWEEHSALTFSWANELARTGYLVIIGGDTNTPRDRAAYKGALREEGRGYDRLAVTKLHTRLHSPEYLSRVGSDHPRLRATLEVTNTH